MRKRVLWFGVVAYLAILPTVAVVSTSPSDAPPPLLALAELTVDTPDTVEAGERFDVTITGLTAGEPLDVIVRSTYASQALPFLADGPTATVVVDSAEIGSGIVVIDAITETATGTTVIEVLSGEVAGPLDLFVGPRTVVADGEDASMLVAVPVDAFGNPVSPGTVVHLDAARADGTNVSYEAETAGLLSFSRIPSTTVSGRTTIAVGVGDATGPGRSFENVPGPPVTFSLHAEPLAGTTTDWVGDGTTLRTIKTDVLIDRFTNVVADGTTVELRLAGPDGVSLLVAMTIDGVATFVVESPTLPGAIVATATTADTSSEPLAIQVEAAIDDVEVVARRSGERTTVDIGPVLLSTGFFVPDGTVAAVRFNGQRRDVVLDEGRAILIIEDAQPDVLTVEVLGVTTTMALGGSR